MWSHECWKNLTFEKWYFILKLHSNQAIWYMWDMDYLRHSFTSSSIHFILLPIHHYLLYVRPAWFSHIMSWTVILQRYSNFLFTWPRKQSHPISDLCLATEQRKCRLTWKKHPDGWCTQAHVWSPNMSDLFTVGAQLEINVITRLTNSDLEDTPINTTINSYMVWESVIGGCGTV